MGKLWDIIEAHMDAETYQISEAQVSRRLGMKSPSTLNNWKHGTITELPRRDYLWAVVDLTGVSIQRVLDAALTDAGYYERGEEHAERAAATKDAEGTSANVIDLTQRQPPARQRAARRGVKKKDDDPTRD